MATISMGGKTFAVPLRLFALNRERLVTALKQQKDVPPKSVVFLRGGQDSAGLYETDAEDWAFKQESYFNWCFGVQEPDFYGSIDVDSGKSTLYMPKLDPTYAIWMGKINGPDWFKEKYQVDEVQYIPDMKSHLLNTVQANLLLLLYGQNTDTGKYCEPASFEGIDSFKTDKDLLHPVIAELRVFKTELELQVLRYACQVSAHAHKAMMKAVKPGLYEYQMESIFRHNAYYHGGCRHVGYCCIGASGPNCSVLHYGHAAAPNARLLGDGDMCLFDMGAAYMRYTADVTCSYPVNGKFTDKQKLIYNAVLDASLAVMNTAKPGVSWVDMHRLANRKILEALKAGGLLTGNVEEMMAVNLGATFQPHGLGHFIGIDVHDVHGYPKGVNRLKEAGLKSLRFNRDLEANMFITIEPGCYFIDHVRSRQTLFYNVFSLWLLDEALADPARAEFMVKDRVNEFRNFGGVRIEDDVLITETGTENFSIVPRTVKEIEAFMSSAEK